MICHKDITKRDTSNQAIKRYQLKQAIKGYQLNQLDQRSYEPHELRILRYEQSSVVKKLEKIPMICAQIRIIYIWIQSAQNRIIAPPKSIETYNKCKRAYRKLSLLLATNTWLSNK